MRAQYWLQFRNITFYVFEISLYVQQACIYKKNNNIFKYYYNLK